MENSLSTLLENDLIRIQNIIHSIRNLNNSNTDIAECFKEGNDLQNNCFAINELLDVLEEIRFSQRFTDYSNAIYKTECEKVV